MTTGSQTSSDADPPTISLQERHMKQRQSCIVVDISVELSTILDLKQFSPLVRFLFERLQEELEKNSQLATLEVSVSKDRTEFRSFHLSTLLSLPEEILD